MLCVSWVVLAALDIGVLGVFFWKPGFFDSVFMPFLIKIPSFVFGILFPYLIMMYYL